MKHLIFSIFLMYLAPLGYAQKSNKKIKMNTQTYGKALVSYPDFKNLLLEAEKHRESRLISFDEFLRVAKEKNVVVLDTRSAFRFNRKHLRGAVNLNFSDFTQENLRRIIPDTQTRVLIYCNNNFDGDRIDFASKISIPERKPETQILPNRKPRMLALNVPTYITLFGYGYVNVYELDELVNVKDNRAVFEGTEVK